MIENVQKIINTVVQELYGVDVVPQITMPEAEFGDFATNIAFMLAAPLKKAPRVIADELVGAINGEQIARVDAAGAGFINISMNSAFWINQLEQIDDQYGKNNLGLGKKMQVEFISANPTGPLTMANARGGYLGDVLANVMTYAGWDVTREYYINDAGNQVIKLAQSIKSAAGIELQEEIQYNGDYVKDLAEELSPTPETDDVDLATRAVALLLSQIKQSVEKMGIFFDVWFSEGYLLKNGLSASVLELLKTGGLVYEQDGAVWLASSRYGDERDRVVVKSDGEYVYLLNDLAYHHDIFSNRGFDKAIKIWGADHAGQVSSLKLTVNQLEPGKELDFILMQLVRLIRDGVELKMSKRAGVYVTMEEVLNEVGTDVARFFFLMRPPETQMDFDLDLAKERSQKNPLFYVMYSYARANSILNKALEKKLAPALTVDDLSLAEAQLVRKISSFPELIEQISQDYGVHRLTFFGIELAKLFHDFYESVRIIDLPVKEAASKLMVVQKYLIFMKLYFSILGIVPTEKM